MRPSRSLRAFLIGALSLLIIPSAIAGPFMLKETEPNDSPATANYIASSAVVVEGSITPSNDVDVYYFTATAGDRIFAATMTAFGTSAGLNNTVLELVASDGLTVLESDDDNGSFNDLSSSIAGAPIPSTGAYFLRVSDGFGQQIIPYRLYFQLRSGSPDAEVEPNNTAVSAQSIGSGWISGSTTAATDQDFYSITLNAGDTVFASLDLNPQRGLTEWNGALSFSLGAQTILADDPGGPLPSSEALFITVRDAGTYPILVASSPSGSTFGAYALNVTVFPAYNEGTNCQTYVSTNVPVAIPSGPGSITSSVTVPGNPIIHDLDVAISLTHAHMSDIQATLTLPSGNTIQVLASIVTSNAFTTMDVTLDDEAAIPVDPAVVLQGAALTPARFVRLSWFDGQPAGGTWTLTIYDKSAGSGGSLNGWSLRICEPGPAAQCSAGYVPMTVFTTDFESGTDGFTHSGAPDQWAWGLPAAAPITTCNSGTHCWKTNLFGSYADNSNVDLLSPPINLTGVVVPPLTVEWAQQYQMESAAFDHFFVEAREAALPSNAVRLFEHLGPTMQQIVGNPPNVIQEVAGWSVFRHDISALAQKAIELRFHLDSDAAADYAGAAIDDVKVTGCALQPPVNLVATATSQTNIDLVWDPSPEATSYTVERRDVDVAGFAPIASGVTLLPFQDKTTVGDHAYVYRVKAVSALATSPYSNADVATTFDFLDDPLTAGTPILGVHIRQLRSATNALRRAVGLGDSTFTDSLIDDTVGVKKVHIDDLRTAIHDALHEVGIADPAYTDATLVQNSTGIRIEHVSELRDALR